MVLSSQPKSWAPTFGLVYHSSFSKAGPVHRISLPLQDMDSEVSGSSMFGCEDWKQTLKIWVKKILRLYMPQIRKAVSALC
jgi:hypothetical protein